jgi:hypothetical protein
MALQPAGQDPEALIAPGAVTLPLVSQLNASSFGIMLLLVWGRRDHGTIPVGMRKSSGFIGDLVIEARPLPTGKGSPDLAMPTCR